MSNAPELRCPVCEAINPSDAQSCGYCGAELWAQDAIPRSIAYRGFEGYDGWKVRTFASPAELKAHVDQIQQWYDSTNPGAEFTDWTAAHARAKN
jgi:hypothetical protein